jgi:hypothetical protein
MRHGRVAVRLALLVTVVMHEARRHRLTRGAARGSGVLQGVVSLLQH